jgi:hypothetical protein
MIDSATLFQRIVEVTSEVINAAEKAGLPVDPGVHLAIFAHPAPMRHFAIEAGKTPGDVVLRGPYESGWTCKWRAIHVIEDSLCERDRISLHLNFKPGVHFMLDGRTVLAIDPVTLDLTKRYRAVAADVLKKLGLE